MTKSLKNLSDRGFISMPVYYDGLIKKMFFVFHHLYLSDIALSFFVIL